MGRARTINVYKEKGAKLMSVKVQNGDKVSVHYTGKFEDGEVFDSSIDRDPLDVEVGAAHVIKGFEDALLGMEEGGTKTIAIPPDQGYGAYDPALVIEMPNTNIPEGVTPEIGMKFRLSDDKGQSVLVMVAEIGDESIKLDANHPLAGKVLVFDLELVNIVKS
jgi:FKBP-type peptidyl-prolyl cis-trans isomerase 2